jgi:hypothetical protein
MKKAGFLLIALGILIAFFVFGMGVTASHKTGVLNDRQNIIYLSGILFLSGIILFGFGVFDKKDKVIKSDKVFFNSTKVINWIFRIGIFVVVLFLLVISAIKMEEWYNYDRHKEKIDISVSFNTNMCNYQNPVHVKIKNNSVRTISEAKIWVIVTERGYSKPLNALGDSLDSYKIIESGEEWSSCWSVFAGSVSVFAGSVFADGARLDSSGKEVHLKDFSVHFQSEEESKKIYADRAAILRKNTDKFVDNKNGTVTFKAIGLTWQKCSVGQTWTGDTCSGDAIGMTWNDAMKLSNSFAGYNDWRLPTKEELIILVFCSDGEYDADGSCINYETVTNPTINSVYFPNTQSFYWSSSPDANGSSNAWDVYFGSGNSLRSDKGLNVFVRLVR